MYVHVHANVVPKSLLYPEYQKMSTWGFYLPVIISEHVVIIIKTQSGSLGEQEILWEQSLSESVPTTFLTYSKLSWVLLKLNKNTENNDVFRTYPHEKRKEKNVTETSNCKFSLLRPSFLSTTAQTTFVVLSFFQVMETWFLTNQHTQFFYELFSNLQ